MNVRRQGDRIILVKQVARDLVLNIIHAYAPQVGLDMSAKRQFLEEWVGIVGSVSVNEKLLIGDLDGHVGTTKISFQWLHGGFGYGDKNKEGEGIPHFVVA